jgi:hypothetical protein
VQDLGPLRDEITFVTNSFYLHPIVSRSWQPGYYCLSDPVYFNGTVPIAEFRAITERIDSAPFFVPHSAHDFIIQHQALPESRTYYFAGADFIHDSSVSAVDLTTVTIGVQTVVQLAIVAAIFMGCSEIYLLGMDHDWLSHGGSHLNFYSQQDASSQPAGNLEGWTYRSMMEAVTTMWKIYEQLGHIAESQGIKIINATRGGFLDVFARETYEPIVGLADPAETDVLPRK